MKKKKIITILSIGIIILLIIAYLNNAGDVQNNEPNLVSPPPALDVPMAKNINSFNKENIKTLNNEGHNVATDKFNQTDTFDNSYVSLAPSVIKQMNEDLESLMLQHTMDMGFSEEAAKKMLSGEPNNSVLSIDSLPAELQPLIKEELEKNKKNGYDEVSKEDSEGIVNIVNYIIDTSPTIPNIRFTLSKIPNIIAYNYNYIGYSFPNTSLLGVTSGQGIQGTARRIFQKLDQSHILIVEESTLQNGSANLIMEFINAQVFGYPAIYAIKKTPSEKKYAVLNWTTKNFSYSLYLVNSIDNAQNILGEIGSSLTEINLEKNIPSKEQDSIPVQEQPKANPPF